MFGLPQWLNPGARIPQFFGAMRSNRQQDRAQRRYEALADQLRADSLDYASQIGPEQLNTYDDSAGLQRDELENLRESQRYGTNRLQRQAARMLSDRTKNVMGDFDQGAREYKEGLGDFLTQFKRETDKLNKGYQDRYNTATQSIEGYGAQQAADIDEDFAKREAAAQQAHVDSGWGNSFASAGTSAQMGRERSNEQRRLGEDLTRMKTGLQADLSGDQLRALENRLAGGSDYGFSGMGQTLNNQLGRAELNANLTGDEANSQQNLGLFGLQNDAAMGGNVANFWGNNAANRSNIVGQGMGTYLNTLTDYNLVPPESNAALMNQFGANMVEGPQDQRNWFEKYVAPAIPGVGAAAGGLVGGMGGGGAAPNMDLARMPLNAPGGPLYSPIGKSRQAPVARTRMAALTAPTRRGGLTSKRRIA